jgi:hypothetical protein
VINPATRPSNELNDFTRQFSMMTEGWPTRTDEYWVRLRNGTLVRPVFKSAEDATCEDAFYAEGYRYCWNLDGTSVTSRHYDMMEIVRND